MTSTWPLTPVMHFTLLRGSSHQIWGHRALLSKLTLLDLSWPLHDLWPQQCITLGSGWPLHDLWPQQCISLCSGVLPTKFGGHRALLSKLTLLDLNWPLHDLWPQQCITLGSGILPTKFGGHGAFLSNLTPGWPQMTPSWPLTPAMHYALVRGPTHQIW